MKALCAREVHRRWASNALLPLFEGEKAATLASCEYMS